MCNSANVPSTPRRPLRVLVLALHEAWPLNCGGRLHLYNVLTQLARRAQVTLALPFALQHSDRLPREISVETIIPTSDRDTALVPHLFKGGWVPRPFKGGGQTPASPSPRTACGRPASLIGWLARRHFGTRPDVAEWLHRNACRGRFDVVLLNGAVAGQYAPHCRLPVVWNPQDELVLPAVRDAELSGWAGWPGALRRVVLYALYERWVARQAAATIYVSSVDAACARRWVGEARLEVVQNGVDFEYFQPQRTPPVPGTLVFAGSLDFGPNVDGAVHFATQVWPHIHARGADRRLLLVGRDPAAEVRMLATRPGITVHPNVPDVRPYITRAAVVIVPVRKGGGLKNKILEGCALRRPVVASLRALGGLSAHRSTDVLAADTPADWVARIDRLLRRPECARTVARNGHAWVHRAHSWTYTGERFLEILCHAARRLPENAPVAPDSRDDRTFTAEARPHVQQSPQNGTGSEPCVADGAHGASRELPVPFCGQPPTKPLICR